MPTPRAESRTERIWPVEAFGSAQAVSHLNARRLLVALLGAAVVTAAAIAGAAQTQVVLSTAPPPATPHLVGASVVGALPRAPFVHRVAATGQRPIAFAAAGLPTGLSIDAATGIITGAVAAAGQYGATLTATNAAGTDRQAFAITVGTTLALTPPMGWNSYDSYDDAVTESDVTGAAQTLLGLLQTSGWQYVVVDYRWYDPAAPASNQNQPGINATLVIDGYGRFLPAPNRFPSAVGSVGFKPLADQIHSLGLKFGIHIMRGIPRRAVQANTPIAGSVFHAADAAATADVSPWNSDMYGVNGSTPAGQAWYDSILQQYGDWGVDFVKVDDLLDNQVTPNLYHQSEVDAVRRALDKTGKAIVFSVSPGEVPVSSAADLVANANMWRMANDFWDTPAQLDHMFALGFNWQTTSSPGHWPDADMLPLGYLGPHCPVGGNHATRFTKNEQVSMMSLWAILPSPLMLGANLTQLQSDAWTTALLTDDEVLAIDQDPLGKRARQVASSGPLGAQQEVWERELDMGRTAVALFNHGAADQQVSVTWAQLGIPASSHVRDVWARADVIPAGPGAGLSAVVPYRGAALFVVSPSFPFTGAEGGEAGADEGGVVAGGADSAILGGADGPRVGSDASLWLTDGAAVDRADATDDSSLEAEADDGSRRDGGAKSSATGPAATSVTPSANGCACSLSSTPPEGRRPGAASVLAWLFVAGAVRRRWIRTA